MRLEQADPEVQLAMIQRLLPPGFVISSPVREDMIAVLVSIAEHTIAAREEES